MGRVLVLGSLNGDLVTRVERHPRPGETVLGKGLSRYAGGKGGNQAVAAARAGAEVRMVGAVGSDEAGSAYVERLVGLGIDVSGVAVVDGPSGHALITVDEDGENVIVVIPGANAAVGAASLDALGDVGPGDVLLAQLVVPLRTVAAAVRHAAHRGARVVLNTAPYSAIPADAVALADPVVANEHEAVLLADSELPFERNEIDDRSVELDRMLSVEVPKGAAVFFGPFLVHRSAPNRSGADRRAVLYTYQRPGNRTQRDNLKALFAGRASAS
jgi:ribokinase